MPYPVEDGLSTKGSTGKLPTHILTAIAQFERSLVLQRTCAGLAAAAVGRVGGNNCPVGQERTEPKRVIGWHYAI